jgi:tetratricopeptide (TPR) repeat protein
LALYACLPVVVVAVALAFAGSPEAALARIGMVAGLIAVTAYDATRLPFVLSGIWPDFIPRVGGWVLLSDEPHALLGYLWRYVGNGGGIGIFFALLCAILGVRRRLPLVGVAYGVFVWSGLMGTVAFAAEGSRLLFGLTPLSIALSLTGHLVYGSVLGWMYARMLSRNLSAADVRARELPGVSFLVAKVDQRQAPAASAAAAPAVPSEPSDAGYDAQLATALDNLGKWKWAVGRHEESLTATQEAVLIQRPLAQARPEVYEPVLALSLSNLAARLADVGRYPDALPIAEESVALYRRLLPLDRANVESRLAPLLASIGGWLWALGRCTEAMTATEEAVELQRRLASADPVTFEPVLAGSLNSLGVQLAELNRFADALPVTEESVALYRRVSARSPVLDRPAVVDRPATQDRRAATAVLDRPTATAVLDWVAETPTVEASDSVSPTVPSETGGEPELLSAGQGGDSSAEESAGEATAFGRRPAGRRGSRR